MTTARPYPCIRALSKDSNKAGTEPKWKYCVIHSSVAKIGLRFKIRRLRAVKKWTPNLDLKYLNRKTVHTNDRKTARAAEASYRIFAKAGTYILNE